MDKHHKIIITGGAGLVGQNLIVRLKREGFSHIVAIDKHPANTAMLRKLHPDITVVESDLAESGEWEATFAGAGTVVLNQAQIGGLFYEDFKRNNITATENILAVAKRQEKPPFIVHISSSVLNSKAVDFYTETKKAQEQLVLDSGLPCTVLRPTLMFGWFDRKHLGWLSRFMKKVPVFPIPGHGRYMRQPLYVGDFCNIIISCIEHRVRDGIFNISGHERVDYIDIIREIKRSTGAGTVILCIPLWLFYALLWVWGLFDKNPPFTTQQLDALSAKDEFEVIDWPGMFGVRSTPFKEAIHETFNDPRYSHVVLKF